MHCEVTPEQIKKAMESQMAEDDQKLYEAPGVGTKYEGMDNPSALLTNTQ